MRNADGQYLPLNVNQTYQVITINFLADGQDFYTSLKGITGDRRIDVGLDYAEAFLQYVESMPGAKGQKVLTRLPVEHYSTQHYKE